MNKFFKLKPVLFQIFIMGIILMSRSGFAQDNNLMDISAFSGKAKGWTKQAWDMIVLILNIVCAFTALWNIWEGTMGKGDKTKAWMNLLYIAVFFGLVNKFETLWKTLTDQDLFPA